MSSTARPLPRGYVRAWQPGGRGPEQNWSYAIQWWSFAVVLVVLGGGWNHYNWPQLLELLDSGNVTSQNERAFSRARNLLYVALSRPKRRLAVLVTQSLSDSALNALSSLFGEGNVLPAPH